MQKFPVRNVKFLASCYQIRKASTSTLLDALQRESVDPQVIDKVLKNTTFSGSELEDLHSLLKSNVSSEVTNEVLRYGLAQDFSLYFTLAKLDKEHQWNELALLSLIENNPARVHSLLDLVKKHSTGPVSNAVRQALVRKLLYGENAELRDGEFELTEDSIRKAIGILNELSGIEGNEDFLNTIFDFLIANNAVSGARLLELEGLAEWLCQHKLSLITNKVAFLQVAKLVFDAEPQLLSKEVLSKVLAYSADVKTFEHEPKTSNLLSNLGLNKEQIELTGEQLVGFGEQVLAFVEEHHLDFDKRDAEALLLRMQLIQTYGIDKNNIQTALEKFHNYQSHEKFGIELVQSKLVQAFCYQSFKYFDEMSYKIAETLVIPDEIPVTTICHLILASSQFDGEKSLQIYNDYIGQVSKKLNQSTNRSPAGILTESMMIASVYENDREFAQLLFEKALANNVVCEEEIPALKKVFKVFGEAYVDDSWEKAKPRLLEYVLETIKRI